MNPRMSLMCALAAGCFAAGPLLAQDASAAGMQTTPTDNTGMSTPAPATTTHGAMDMNMGEPASRDPMDDQSSMDHQGGMNDPNAMGNQGGMNDPNAMGNQGGMNGSNAMGNQGGMNGSNAMGNQGGMNDPNAMGNQGGSRGAVEFRSTMPPAPETSQAAPSWDELSNGSRSITAEQAASYPLLANDFIHADRNGDGRVSKSEYERWKPQD